MIQISCETEACINDETRRQAVSADELPRLHLGLLGDLHRTDIYDDVG